MKNLILLLMLFMPSLVHASQLTYGTTWAPNGQVTSANLNGNFSNVSSVINGKLDNTNSDTTNGYFFYRTVSVLPSAGVQGSTYFLTSDNSLNLDTGSSFAKTITITSPTTGGIAYYNSGWNNLTIGSNGQALVSNGTIPGWGIVGSIGGGTGANLSASLQGSVPYFSATGVQSALGTGTSGQVLETQGASANPTWVNALSSVSDYGASTVTSTAKQATATKIAYGHGVSVASGSSTSITNLPFTSSSSYSCTTSENDSAVVDQSRGALGFTYTSGSQANMYNTDDATRIGAWICVGT